MAIAESRDKVDNIEGGDSVSDCNMDVSGGGGAGDDKEVGNLYETLEMIVEGAKSSAVSDTQDDVCLNEILDMIDEGAKKSVSSEAEPESEIIPPINEVRFEGEGISVGESTDVGGDETKSACDVANNSVGAPTDGDSGSGESAINIDSGVEMDKAGGDTNKSVKSNPSDSVSAVKSVDVKSVCKSECAGDTISAIPPIPRFCLREIFRHAEGEFINATLCFLWYIGGGKCGICWGSCCPLVNLMLKSLVEIGELGMNTEVSFYI